MSSKWSKIDPGHIANTCSPRHIQSVLEDAKQTIEEMFTALQAANQALDAIGDEMTLGERYTNAGQYLIDSVPLVREAIEKSIGDKS